MLQKVDTRPLTLQPYHAWMDEEMVKELERLATSLQGLRVAHLNATSVGGGVAEILQSLVPMMNCVGVKTDWYCLSPDDAFFQVTKNIHNSLQGGEWQFDASSREIFLRHNQRIAAEVGKLDVDLWVVHDPQPCAMHIEHLDTHQAIWHCHIDTSTPNRAVWDFLSGYVRKYDHLVFCMPEYVNGSISSDRVRFLRPAIDPLVAKNRPLPKSKARAILAGLCIDPQRPLISQVARFDPWKDPLGVIDAYRLVKQDIPELQLALVGVMEAQDDPEAVVVLEQVQQTRAGDPDIHLFADPVQVGALEVNAFQTASEVVLQKSLREGFGLTVAEAMWKGSAVIGGNCGGIREQIQDGENGYLVDTPEACAGRIIELLRNKPLRQRLGANGRESVRRRYLMPRLLHEYLALMETVVLGI